MEQFGALFAEVGRGFMVVPAINTYHRLKRLFFPDNPAVFSLHGCPELTEVLRKEQMIDKRYY